RDLHDVLGHTLSVIVLKSELAGRLFVRDPERAAREIADVEMISRKALSEVREAIRGYRAEGLAAEIKRAQSTLDAAGVTLVFDEKPPELNPAVETVMSLVVREAVTNIVRHARASQCSMRISAQNGHTLLVVEDDGRGGVSEEGNGLRGMRERVEGLGGRFAVDSSRGTRLTIQLPTAARSELSVPTYD
ncbi:MAG TPA: sensor histidine kinase, partial [Silvibacterium sp.]|nr:sensor histidine kinase [Silvibacterium sp.]